jgi:hypothetical protein
MLEQESVTARYRDVDRQKSDGATYTPKAFAMFVAEQIVQAADLPKNGKYVFWIPLVVTVLYSMP